MLNVSFIIVRLGSTGETQKLDFSYGLELNGQDGSTFQLKKAIRGGGNGVVFEADCFGPDGTAEGLVAVKLLKELDEVRQDRFNNEERILRALDHPKITRCFGSGVVKLGWQEIEVPWISMSLGDVNLRQYLDTQRQPLDLGTVLGVGMQICDAIKHLHDKDIIHRDLKPANVVWDSEDDRENIFLIDFGIAKYIGEDVSARKMDDLTSLTEFVGPANFASPELLQYARDKTHPVGIGSDLFQIGLLLWFLATNQVSAGIPSKSRDPSGGKLHALVLSLLAEDPADRPQSTSEVYSALEEIRASM